MAAKKKVLQLNKKLIAQDLFPFTCKGERINVSEKHGVYIIYDKNEKVLHVGRTVRGEGGLNKRLNNHRCGKSSFMRNFFKDKEKRLWSGGYQFRYIKVADDKMRTYVEALTTGLECPEYIGTSSTNTI
ncbi:MAG TPA: GIY-YIG nuclease family protein [Bacteroidia bacterium]|nr:GIY-YIG nuclease family protein [Bacteroidia bacterium]HNU33638.1 GIY-YIG nuclease family protein [Bacteroidia bacterium]